LTALGPALLLSGTVSIYDVHQYRSILFAAKTAFHQYFNTSLFLVGKQQYPVYYPLHPEWDAGSKNQLEIAAKRQLFFAIYQHIYYVLISTVSCSGINVKRGKC